MKGKNDSQEESYQLFQGIAIAVLQFIAEGLQQRNYRILYIHRSELCYANFIKIMPAVMAEMPKIFLNVRSSFSSVIPSTAPITTANSRTATT